MDSRCVSLARQRRTSPMLPARATGEARQSSLRCDGVKAGGRPSRRSHGPSRRRGGARFRRTERCESSGRVRPPFPQRQPQSDLIRGWEGRNVVNWCAARKMERLDLLSMSSKASRRSGGHDDQGSRERNGRTGRRWRCCLWLVGLSAGLECIGRAAVAMASYAPPADDTWLTIGCCSDETSEAVAPLYYGGGHCRHWTMDRRVRCSPSDRLHLPMKLIACPGSLP